MIQEVLVAFIVGFVTGLVYESQRVTRIVRTDKGLMDFLLVHAPWHVKRIAEVEEENIKRAMRARRRDSPISLIIKVVSLGTIILIILLTSGVF